MKKTYQIPTLNQDIVFGECQLLVGTTIPVVPGEEGSQADAESKSTGDYFGTRASAPTSTIRSTICPVYFQTFGERNDKPINRKIIIYQLL